MKQIYLRSKPKFLQDLISIFVVVIFTTFCVVQILTKKTSPENAIKQTMYFIDSNIQDTLVDDIFYSGLLKQKSRGYHLHIQYGLF